MHHMICQQCHKPLSWDGRSETVSCPYCGMRYRMHPRSHGSGAGVRVGTGTVSKIMTSQGRYAGQALVKSFIPKNYTVETNACETQSNMLNPLALDVTYTSAKQDVLITYTGTRGFDHLEPTPENAAMQGHLSMPDRIMKLAYRDAENVCRMAVAQNPTISDVRLLSVMKAPDEFAQKSMQRAIQNARSAHLLEPGATWSKLYLTVRDQGGRTWHKLVEAMVFFAYLPVSEAEQMAWQMLQQSQARMMGLMGSGMFAGLANMAPQQLQPPQPKLRWGIDYLIETSATEEAFPEAMAAHEKIRDTMEVLPLFRQEYDRSLQMILMQAQQDQQALNGALEQMSRDQLSSWDRRQQIVSDTNDYTSSIMHDMQTSNAATWDRVHNLQSEAIRDVNTYYTAQAGHGVPDVVEASTNWDHLYQDTQHPDHFAASTGDAPLEFGVDFEELKRTGGNY